MSKMNKTSKTNKRALGRGFESLIPTELFDESFDPTSEQDATLTVYREVQLDQIEPDPDQPRKKFDQESLDELADSIKQHGVLQPIVVTRQQGKKKYQIVAGERRYRAAVQAELATIPALIRSLSNQNKLELSLIENVQRQDLNIIEVATGYVKLRDQFNLTLTEIGKRVGGKTPGTISNTLRLLRLPKFAIEALNEGLITEGQSRPLVGADPKLVKKLLPQIIKGNWSARRVEAVMSNYRRGEDLKQTVAKTQDKIADKSFVQDASKLTQKISMPVKITPLSRGGGKLEIKFKNLDQLDKIKKLLNR